MSTEIYRKQTDECLFRVVDCGMGLPFTHVMVFKDSHKAFKKMFVDWWSVVEELKGLGITELYGATPTPHFAKMFGWEPTGMMANLENGETLEVYKWDLTQSQ